MDESVTTSKVRKGHRQWGSLYGTPQPKILSDTTMNREIFDPTTGQYYHGSKFRT